MYFLEDKPDVTEEREEPRGGEGLSQEDWVDLHRARVRGEGVRREGGCGRRGGASGGEGLNQEDWQCSSQKQ